MNISLDTLQFLFSAIPQTLGAVLAVLIAIIFFRINKIQKILIGEGKCVLGRKDEPEYKVLKDWRFKRLEDAIHRENIPEIKEVIKFLYETEVKLGYPVSKRPRGFKYLYQDRFLKTEAYVNNLMNFAVFVSILSLLTIILSLFFLAHVDCISLSPNKEIFAWSIIILTTLAIISIAIIVRYSLIKKIIYEDLDLRDEVIQNNKNESTNESF